VSDYDKWIALQRDPDFQIRMCRSAWQGEENPVYVWSAIAICAKHKKPLPDWVMDYLAGVAQRMTSDVAKATTDLRAVLPGILGFSAKQPGPGRPSTLTAARMTRRCLRLCSPWRSNAGWSRPRPFERPPTT
jgi:hypothetical protein